MCTARWSANGLFATVVELAGIDRRAATGVDSLSLVPYLKGEPKPLRETLYTEQFRPNFACRDRLAPGSYQATRHAQALRDARSLIRRTTRNRSTRRDARSAAGRGVLRLARRRAGVGQRAAGAVAGCAQATRSARGPLAATPPRGARSPGCGPTRPLAPRPSSSERPPSPPRRSRNRHRPGRSAFVVRAAMLGRDFRAAFQMPSIAALLALAALAADASRSVRPRTSS